MIVLLGRFHEVDERHEGSWHGRRGERGYRESERYHEARHAGDAKPSSRIKRSRPSPETARSERKGQSLPSKFLLFYKAESILCLKR